MRWLTNWQLWALVTFVLCGGLGGASLMMLLRLPALPNCGKSIFWEIPSASEHLYCAQKAANDQTVQGLLTAIAEVHKLPQDHPLRPEINRQIEKWAVQLLDLSEKTFQEGKLDEAIATARQIPSNTTAAQLVNERVERWQSIWDRAETIYQDAESQLEQENWGQAFRHMRQLLSVGNTYWETNQYEALNQLIQATQEDGKVLDKGRRMAEEGGLKNLIEAIKLVEKIAPKSKLYKESRSLVTKFARQILDLARETQEKKNWQDAIYTARQVPANSSVKTEAEDLIELVRARSIAARATVRSLEDAIAKAQLIGADRPLYREAQGLIVQWQDSIKDVAYLEKARRLARAGTVRDLRAAIAEAEQVSRNNPVWDEAEAEITGWTNQIEITEDRPYLTQAEQLANYADRASLEAAIAAANRIAPGRALYQEAQQKTEMWRQEIQRVEDRPMLDQAWNLADLGNLKAAIAMAQTIRSGRVLYQEAQSAIQTWQQQISDRDTLDRAYKMGDRAQSASRLLDAIEVANQVSSSSNLRYSADAAINDWSQRLLAIAQQESTYNLPGAIEVAKKIPDYSPVYGLARREIEAWEIMLNPPPAPIPEPAPQITNETANPPVYSSASPSDNPPAEAPTQNTAPEIPSYNPTPEIPTDRFSTPALSPQLQVDPIEGVGN